MSREQKRFILSNIVILGLVSFFMDIGTEMVYPILPLYLTSVLGATPAIIGVIQGIAESLASVLKLFPVSSLISTTIRSNLRSTDISRHFSTR